MPKMLQAMFDEKNLNIKVYQITYSGYSLKSHLNSIVIGGNKEMLYTREKKVDEATPTERLLKSDTIFDHIILQERTSLAIIDDIRTQETIPAIHEIMKIARGKPNFWFYQNFPTNEGYPKTFCKQNTVKQQVCSDTINSIHHELSLLNHAFNKMGDDSNIVKIGQCFSEVKRKNYNINLYTDDSHPSKYGSYLIALNFFRALTNESPKTLKYNAELDDSKAKLLKEIVSEI